jgi:hypothetical protein
MTLTSLTLYWNQKNEHSIVLFDFRLSMLIYGHGVHIPCLLMEPYETVRDNWYFLPPFNSPAMGFGLSANHCALVMVICRKTNQDWQGLSKENGGSLWEYREKWVADVPQAGVKPHTGGIPTPSSRLFPNLNVNSAGLLALWSTAESKSSYEKGDQIARWQPRPGRAEPCLLGVYGVWLETGCLLLGAGLCWDGASLSWDGTEGFSPGTSF